MEAQFAVDTTQWAAADTYFYSHYIATDFVCKLNDIIKPFGYTIYPKQYKPVGTSIPMPDPIEDTAYGTSEASTTNRPAAAKLKVYSKDFRIENADGTSVSRWFRIRIPQTKKSKPLMCIVDDMKTKRNDFRELAYCSPGRSDFLNSFSEHITSGNVNLKWNKWDTFQTPAVWYFTVVVNEDMVLVFGGDQLRQSESCVHANYMSYIRMFSIERNGKVKWATNGLMGVSPTEVIADVPVSQKVADPYARIGTLFKCAEAKGASADWVCPRILVLPKVSTYAKTIRNENYTLFFNNDYNDYSENKLYYLYTISKLCAKPCLVLM